jgi:hypothetical protein
MVFGGTTLLQHSDGEQATDASSEKSQDGAGISASGKSVDKQLFAVKARKVLGALPSTPDGGCTALVVRTGFGTSQVRHWTD